MGKHLLPTPKYHFKTPTLNPLKTPGEARLPNTLNTFPYHRMSDHRSLHSFSTADTHADGGTNPSKGVDEDGDTVGSATVDHEHATGGQLVRTTRACAACSKHKVRCTGGLPCARCSVLKSECLYLPSLRGKTRKRKTRPEGDENTRKAAPSISLETPSSSMGIRDAIVSQPHLRKEDISGENIEREADFAAWSRDNLLFQNGPRNSVLWEEDTLNLYSDSVKLGQSSRQTVCSPDLINKVSTVDDKLTTLPLPGDALNPLSVLAEASAHARRKTNGDIPQVPLPPVKENGGVDRVFPKDPADVESTFYAKLDRVLKEDAPHIMTLISTQECVCQLIDACLPQRA